MIVSGANTNLARVHLRARRYKDYWSYMGNGMGYQEGDKRRLDWIQEHEVELILAHERAIPKETYYDMYPAG